MLSSIVGLLLVSNMIASIQAGRAWDTERCFLDKVDFQGFNMRGTFNPKGNVASKEDCINICNTYHSCKGLTFKADAKLCWLKSIHFTPQTEGYVTNYDYVTGSLNMDCLQGSCAAGEYLGAHGCQQCSAGSYSSAHSTECTQCAAGSYSAAGESQCSQCEPGSYSEAGASGCYQCPYADCGSFVLTAADTGRCFLDEVDFQGADMRGNPRRNLASVEDCINICNTVNGCKGLTFKADAKKCWLKSIRFTPQTDGYLTNYEYVTGSLNMDCLYESCAAGEYMGAYGCQQCAAGSYSSADSTECTQCAAGSYSEAGESQCSQCAPGSYSEAGASDCYQCPYADCGSFVLTAADTGRCFLDKVDLQGADMRGNPRRNLASVEDCINICNTVNGCKGLTFKVETKLCWLKSTLFTPQTNGYKADSQYVTGSVNMECLYGSCAAGEYLGAYGCQQCSVGSYSIADSTECTQCAAGSYSEAGASQCSQCPEADCVAFALTGKSPTIESSQTSYVIGRDSVILTCLTEPDGLSGAAYEWKLNSNTVSGETGRTYTVPNTDSSYAGNYTCIASIASDTSDESSEVEITIKSCTFGPRRWGKGLDSDNDVIGRMTLYSLSNHEWALGRSYEENLQICLETCKQNGQCSGVQITPSLWDHHECFMMRGMMCTLDRVGLQYKKYVRIRS